MQQLTNQIKKKKKIHKHRTTIDEHLVEGLFSK